MKWTFLFLKLTRNKKAHANTTPTSEVFAHLQEQATMFIFGSFYKI